MPAAINYLHWVLSEYIAYHQYLSWIAIYSCSLQIWRRSSKSGLSEYFLNAGCNKLSPLGTFRVYSLPSIPFLDSHLFLFSSDLEKIIKIWFIRIFFKCRLQ